MASIRRWLLWGLALAAPLWASSPQADFEALYAREWAFRTQEFPAWTLPPAERALLRDLGDVSAAAQQRRLAFWSALREELDALDPRALSPAARADLAVFRWQLESRVAGLEHRSWQMPMNSDSSFFATVAMMPGRSPLQSLEQAEAYLARLADIPRLFAQHLDNMRQGIAEGRTLPRVVLAGRDAAALAHAAGPVEDSVFWGPVSRLPEAWPEAEREGLRDRARQIIAEQVQPAYAEVARFLREDYLPAARESLAALELPDGEAWYRAQIREYTTLDLDPHEIHRIGLAEVERILAEMDQIIAGLGFDGDRAAFIAYLRSDPKFYATTPDQLLARARDIAKRIDAELPRYFGTLPRRPYGIAAVPASIAPFYTAGRYVAAAPGSAEPGWYWVNTYDLAARPLFNLPALTLHEAVPGHHLQAALAEEQGERPAFRRASYISAFGEGWALYAEWLGKEMGIYETPYEDFGRLSYEMWRACRLVVDTGIHAKGWTREQAIDYMTRHTGLSAHEIATEVDRYISWPAQALSYKLGELRIRDWRARAERELGTAFDLRDFHDTILALGSVPLGILDETLAAWMAQRQAALIPAGSPDAPAPGHERAPCPAP